MYSDILSTVRTSFDRDTLVSEIEVLKAALFSPKKGGVQAALDNKVRASIASTIKDRMEKGQNIEEYLNGLSHALELIPEVKIILGFEPTNSTLELICNWFDKNNSLVVLDVKVDASVIGGAILSFNGKYYDGSLKKILEEVLFRDKKKVIETVIGASV